MLLKFISRNQLKLFVISVIIFVAGCSAVELRESTEVGQARAILDSWSGQSDRLTRAKTIIDRALIDNPKDVYALKELGRYYVMDGYRSSNVFKPNALDNAEHVLLKATEIDPNFAGSYVMLGHVYFNKNNLFAAEEALRKAESLGTNDLWLHLNWADVLERLGKHEEAKSRYEKVIESGTDNVKALAAAYTFLIEDRRKMGDFESVNTYYQTLFELRPGNAWMRGNYADFLRDELGDFDRSTQFAREALNMMSYGIGYRILGLSLYAQWGQLLGNGSDQKTADEVFAEAVSYYPNFDQAFAYLGANETTYSSALHLVEMGASVNGVQEKTKRTALMDAAGKGNTELTLKLLHLGVDPDIPSVDRYTALSFAIHFGHTKTALALIENGASLEVIDDFSYDPLDVAQYNQNTQVIHAIERKKGQ